MTKFNEILDVKLSQLNIKDHHSIAGLSAFYANKLARVLSEIEKRWKNMDVMDHI